jgi:hypothetical protein
VPRLRPFVALALGLLLVGCSNAADRGGTSGSAASRTPAQGPWASWTRTLTARDKAGTCAATVHQVVCSTAADGLVGRSGSTGAVIWRVPSAGTGKKNDGLVLAAAEERAVTSGGGVLRAANLRTGKGAWSHRLAPGRGYFGVGEADGVVYAIDAPTDAVAAEDAGAVKLTAYSASDGVALWHKGVEADRSEMPYGFGGRVYTTDGTRVTARDARTGEVVATSPPSTQCPHLVSAHGYLLCTGSPGFAGDTFPPVKRLDPATLQPLNTVPDLGFKPQRGLISADGVLVLYEVDAEDGSAGYWIAYDLKARRKLWQYYSTTAEAALDGGRFVSFTPVNETDRGRLITIDLHAGPHGKGADAPHRSPLYPQTNYSNYPSVIAPGGTSGHLVVKPSVHSELRSVPVP